MLEGDTSASSGGEPGGGSTAPPSDSGTSTGSVGPGAAGGTDSLASAGDGSAPVSGVDAVGGEVAPGAPQELASAVPAPSKFKFAGREWETQKQAEEAYKANFGRNWEGKLTAAQQQLAERDAEIQALRRSLSGGPGGQGQGTQQGPQAPAGPHSFAEKFVKSGDLEFITGLLNDPDPHQGIQKFTVALMDRVDREVNERLEQVRSEEIAPIIRQREFERTMGSAMGVARNLGESFPELDNTNQSAEAVEHQQAFVENLKQFPPEFVAQNPQFAMLATALLTRYQHGTPMIAQAPGTSGSPSARAALASQQALAAATGTPIDGTGTPRPRATGGNGETPEDRIRRENAAAPATFRAPNGRDLGFGPA